LIIHTDSRAYAQALLSAAACPSVAPLPPVADAGCTFAESYFGRRIESFGVEGLDPFWRVLLASEIAGVSQYARLTEAARGSAVIPDRLVCAAGSGPDFKGFRGRSWMGRPGNVHLAVHLAPNRPIERFDTVFLALAAVALVEAIDSVRGLVGVARIKWVNDVLIGDAKAGGVLAYTQTRGHTVTSVVLGIGLNVETHPPVSPTPFVPAAVALNDVAGAGPANATTLTWRVLRTLTENYQLLLTEGYGPIMAKYRARSAVLGREVALSSDDRDEVPRIFLAGRVEALGDGLELMLAGRDEPVRTGRLILSGSASGEGEPASALSATPSPSLP
jgi:BirA family transcriptional regulator, biotin operon repressor / biotin---[acetyl-CoA-carboxylase] ligase